MRPTRSRPFAKSSLSTSSTSPNMAKTCQTFGIGRGVRPQPKSAGVENQSRAHEGSGREIDPRHREGHRTGRTGWLRAAVLGANDGIVSTASLVVGVAAAGAVRGEILLAGVAGAVAGALSMAAGEYVSVSSQADHGTSGLGTQRTELAANEDAEQRELAAIYVQRGLEPGLARTVAQQLMAHDALGAHARDELGLSDKLAARPLQAAFASAATFAVGALLPILAVMLPPQAWVAPVVSGASLIPASPPSVHLPHKSEAGQCGAGRYGSPSGAPWRCWLRQVWERFSARLSDKQPPTESVTLCCGVRPAGHSRSRSPDVC